ncbi:28S ribosomal protein S18c, mitochondrial [Solea senegalensis]|uniref:Small ribosomal subunit protein bS18m n=1 Tax=Solea senegalensis TaxID=28829 RepID=A0AAV6R324_SOLSE|nr:28S ribosomal protein S18c, mitochondrial [Solea senegalensis]KAG7499415.1 28S ribosomal protein S18c, mitochondrial [Solea senegalensis]
MFSLRMSQRLKSILFQQGMKGSRSFTSTVFQRKDDVLVKMDNPFKEPPKGCALCNVEVDFKNTQLLSQFVSPHTGRIYSRHITGLCGIKQKQVSKAIKKAQSMGFMSVTHKHPQFMRDPTIFNVKHLS